MDNSTAFFVAFSFMRIIFIPMALLLLLHITKELISD